MLFWGVLRESAGKAAGILLERHGNFAGVLRENREMADWRGRAQCYAEDMLDGIEHCPDALTGLYRAENRDKRLCFTM
jgi:NADPH-dependent curcumin reductase CurA